MKICHLTASVTTSGGGMSEAVRALALQQSQAGIICEVHGLRDDGESLSPWSGGNPIIHAAHTLGGIQCAPELTRSLSLSHPDLVHSHGLWGYPSIAAARWGSAQSKPWVVSPHGMLDSWALARSSWKKKLAGLLFENRNLHGAACLHALCESEADSIRAYGLKNPVCIIPNGVELVDDRDQGTDVIGMLSGKKTILFLGRLHPKKGLVNALKAWAEVGSRRSAVGSQGPVGGEEWQFVIAGWDQGGHEAELKKLCDELNLAYAEVPAADFLSERPTSDRCPPTSVVFVGPAFGEQKDQLLRHASAFILPSFSEGLPMSVLEAWGYHLPVLMTDHCNLPEGFAHHAALRIGTDVESIAEGMADLIRSPISDLRSLGRNGRALVERQFTWPKVAAQMKEVYQWLAATGPRPACVVPAS